MFSDIVYDCCSSQSEWRNMGHETAARRNELTQVCQECPMAEIQIHDSGRILGWLGLNATPGCKHQCFDRACRTNIPCYTMK